MSGVINLSEMVSLALHSMVYIAGSDKKLLHAKEIAEATGASEAHLVKVLQRLVKVNFLSSVRGPKGGFALGKLPEEITLLDIFEAIEGPLNIEGCPMNNKVCAFNACILGGVPEKVSKEFKDYLETQRLSDLISRFKK